MLAERQARNERFNEALQHPEVKDGSSTGFQNCIDICKFGKELSIVCLLSAETALFRPLGPGPPSGGWQGRRAVWTCLLQKPSFVHLMCITCAHLGPLSSQLGPSLALLGSNLLQLFSSPGSTSVLAVSIGVYIYICMYVTTCNYIHCIPNRFSPWRQWRCAVCDPRRAGFGVLQGGSAIGEGLALGWESLEDSPTKHR